MVMRDILHTPSRGKEIRIVKTQCPNCHVKFKVAEEHKGRKVKCPKCSQPFIITPFDAEVPVEVCSNCGRKIGKLEQACILQGERVCSECDQKARISEFRRRDVARAHPEVMGQNEKGGRAGRCKICKTKLREVTPICPFCGISKDKRKEDLTPEEKKVRKGCLNIRHASLLMLFAGLVGLTAFFITLLISFRISFAVTGRAPRIRFLDLVMAPFMLTFFLFPIILACGLNKYKRWSYYAAVIYLGLGLFLGLGRILNVLSNPAGPDRTAILINLLQVGVVCIVLYSVANSASRSVLLGEKKLEFR